jgi:hypothetical protein
MLREINLPSASFFVLRLMISAILVWVAFTCLVEVYRLWFTRPITLGPFTYAKDGADAKDSGLLFARQVNYDLHLIQGLLKAAPADRPPDRTTTGSTCSARTSRWSGTPTRRSYAPGSSTAARRPETSWPA